MCVCFRIGTSDRIGRKVKMSRRREQAVVRGLFAAIPTWVTDTLLAGY